MKYFRRRVVLIVSVAVLAVCLLAVWRAPEVRAWAWRVRSGSPTVAADKPQLASPLRWFDDYYAIADLGSGEFAIAEPRYGQCNFSYLIIGTERALLFDTGPGVRDISVVTRTLTSLPIIALPSHLHFDHSGNLQKFDHIALPDLPSLRRQAKDGQFDMGLYQYLGFVEGFARRPFRVAQWVLPGTDIDLGGRSLRMLSTPGHTPESVVLLDRTANRLFAGDFMYPGEIYAFLPGADLHAYAASAHAIAPMLDERSQILSAHGCDRTPVDVPTLARADVEALEKALVRADGANGRIGTGWYPRILPVNERMTLWATYPWMAK